MILTIPGQPVAKGRPRVTSNGFSYTPEKTKGYENLVKMCWQEKYPEHIPIETAVKVSIVAYFQIPKSWSKKKVDETLSTKNFHCSRPDGDNIIKIILDALNAICFKDDSQVCFVQLEKKYDYTPRTEIAIEKLS